MTVRVVDAGLPDAVLAFLESRVAARGREHWQWKYGRAAAEMPAAFYWQEPDGTVLGFIGLMPTRLADGRSRHRAAWFVDWHVQPGERGVGVGLSLLRRAEAAAGTLLTLQGSAETQRILPRLGWKESRTPRTWVRPLARRFVAERLGRRWRGVPRVLLGALGGAALRLAPLPRFAAPAGARLHDVERLPEGYDQVWERREEELAPVMARDSAYLNHFCADFPEGGYRLQLLGRAGETVGHLVSRLDTDRRGLRRGRIVDLVAPRGEAEMLAWMAVRACEQLRGAGADFVECVASIPEIEQAAARCGFRSRRPVPVWYHRLPDGVADLDRMYVSFLDCDRAYR